MKCLLTLKVSTISGIGRVYIICKGRKGTLGCVRVCEGVQGCARVCEGVRGV